MMQRIHFSTTLEGLSLLHKAVDLWLYDPHTNRENQHKNQVRKIIRKNDLTPAFNFRENFTYKEYCLEHCEEVIHDKT